MSAYKEGLFTGILLGIGIGIILSADLDSSMLWVSVGFIFAGLCAVANDFRKKLW